jgi:2-C-methyl-D-erythritol 4-phosphate cytidylyltransferase
MTTPAPINPTVPRLFALIPSAGHGSRSGLAAPKQYHAVAGRRIIDHTVAVFEAMPLIEQVWVVSSPGDTVYQAPSAKVQVVQVGGSTRAHSVFNGLQTLAASGAQPHDWVLVHDAARCLVTAQDIAPLIEACRTDAVGGLLAIPAADTLKQAVPSTGHSSTFRSQQTLDRSTVWLAQTPQMFKVGLLLEALKAQAATEFAGVTDEASAIEMAGHKPLLVPGSAHNFKVTYPQDIALANILLKQRQEPST